MSSLRSSQSLIPAPISHIAPAIHVMASTYAGYIAAVDGFHPETMADIAPGDVLLIPSQKVVAVADRYPTAVTQHAYELHELGVHPLTWAGVGGRDNPRLLEGLRLAVVVAHRHGFEVSSRLAQTMGDLDMALRVVDFEHPSIRTEWAHFMSML